MIQQTEVQFDAACTLRRIAETGCDPLAYMAAARAFEALGMPAAAKRMAERAEHYFATTEEHRFLTIEEA